MLESTLNASYCLCYAKNGSLIIISLFNPELQGLRTVDTIGCQFLQLNRFVMAQSSPPSISQPLKVGSIVCTAIRLYRSQFSRYILIALRAIAWPIATIVATTVVLGGIVALLAAPLDAPTPFLGLAIFVSVIVWCGFYLYSFAKFLANSALISKLAFNQLTHSTDSPRQACEGIKPKTWAFLRIAIYLGLLYLLAYIAVSTVGSIIFIIPIGILSGIEASPSVWALIALLGLLYVLASIGLFLWLFARWFIAEVVLAIEDNNEAGESISRSWILTEKFSFNVILIIGIGLLIALPFQIIQFVVAFLPEMAVVGLELDNYSYLLVVVLSTFLNVFLGLALLPFWQVLKAVVYLELKARKEALNPAVESVQSI